VKVEGVEFGVVALKDIDVRSESLKGFFVASTKFIGVDFRTREFPHVALGRKDERTLRIQSEEGLAQRGMRYGLLEMFHR